MCFVESIAVEEYIEKDVVQNFRIMSEDVYWQHCIFMLKKNSVLLPSFNDMVFRSIEAGLPAYWELRVRKYLK